MKNEAGKAVRVTLPTVLIIDDEIELREAIADLLSDQFKALQAASAKEGIELAKLHRPSVILLDVIMPGIDGKNACKILREDKKTRDIPIVMLSAAGSTANRIESFKNGADDFIVKPFDPDELGPRLLAKLRRIRELKQKDKGRLVFGNMEVDRDAEIVTVGGERVLLTELEFRLLTMLVARAGRVVSRKEIRSRIWSASEGSDRLIDTHMVSLRKKVALLQNQLETIYGKGYSLRELQDSP